MGTNSAINTTNPIAVGSGGTGASTLTSNGVLLGNGASALSATSAGATGTVLVGNTSAAPTFSSTPTVTSITFGSGSALSNYVATTSWTPVLYFGGLTTGITYTTQTANYVRIGGVVFIEIYIVLSSVGSATGNVSITGFPFTSNAAAYSTLTFLPGDVTYLGQVIGFISNSSSTILLYNISSASFALQLTNTSFAATSTINLTGLVFV